MGTHYNTRVHLCTRTSLIPRAYDDNDDTSRRQFPRLLGMCLVASFWIQFGSPALSLHVRPKGKRACAILKRVRHSILFFLCQYYTVSMNIPDAATRSDRNALLLFFFFFHSLFLPSCIRNTSYTDLRSIVYWPIRKRVSFLRAYRFCTDHAFGKLCQALMTNTINTAFRTTFESLRNF